MVFKVEGTVRVTSSLSWFNLLLLKVVVSITNITIMMVGSNFNLNLSTDLLKT
jgi:hypothetical protein